MPQRSLPHRDRAAVRPLLPLPLVPARNRVGICDQRADRIEPGRGAVGTAGTRGHAIEQRPRADDRSLSAMPDCAVEPLRGGGPAFSFVRVGTLDNPDHLPPDIHIFTSSKQPWVIFRPTCPRRPSTTIGMRIGRRTASSAGACCWRRSQPTKTRRPPLASGALGDRPVAEPNARYAGTNHRIALHICTTIAVRLWHAECSVARYNAQNHRTSHAIQ